MKKLRQLLGRTDGSQVAEAAAVMPVMFLIFLGIFWFGRAYNIYATINHAAREGARAAAVGSCATCGNTPLNGDQIGQVVANAMLASKLDPLRATPLMPSYNHCDGTPASCQQPPSGYPQMCIYNSVVLNAPNSGPPSCGVAISFQYPYQFYLPFSSLGGQAIQLKAQVQMAGEY